VLVISPEKRKTVMGFPEGPAVSLTLTLVVLFCTYSPSGFFKWITKRAQPPVG
jgi:hypothetical protein